MGFKKQFLKALNKGSACFKYSRKNFPHLSAVKVKKSVFVGPQVKPFTKDPHFLITTKDVEKKHGSLSPKLYLIFLEMQKIRIIKTLQKTCLFFYQALGCLMSLKVQILHAHSETPRKVKRIKFLPNTNKE